MKKDATRILKRCEANPILHVDNYPGLAQIYNPSATKFGDETIVLISVVEHAATQGYGRDVGQTRIARSKDGIHFELSDEDFVYAPDLPGAELYHHFIDNRMTKIGDTYYIVTPAMVHGYQCPVGMLGKTKDFKTYEPMDIITAPPNRGASLFPEKINGKYYKLDRPGGGAGVRCDIWISASEDLIHWGEFKPLLAPGYRFWNVQKIGPTPPIKTSKGWLTIIHGVFSPAGGTTYYLGAILLDLEEPWKIIGKTNSYILAPEMDYEQHGNSDNAVFACGAIGDEETDELTIYYGACDKTICMAKGSLSEMVDACIQGL